MTYTWNRETIEHPVAKTGGRKPRSPSTLPPGPYCYVTEGMRTSNAGRRSPQLYRMATWRMHCARTVLDTRE